MSLIRSIARLSTIPGAVIIISCSKPTPVEGISASSEVVQKTPFASRPERAATRFVELGREETGIDFSNPIDETHELRYLYTSAMAVGGIAIADFDGDGKPDLFFSGGPVPNKLFQQTDRLKFEDISGRSGTDGGDAWGVGCAAVDIDEDGDQDVYVCNYLSPNQLFINDGSGVFTEAAEQWGIDFVDASHTPSFCDYDGDGKLDLYILTNRWYRPEGYPDEQTIEMGADGTPQILEKFERFYDARQTGDDRWESVVVGRPDILCRNTGEGRFEIANEKAGIDHRGHGLSAIWWDWNGDGWTDLWVGNDFKDPDQIYLNRGNGTFVEVGGLVVGHLSWFSMGADFGDLNQDGLADFLLADMAGSTHFKQKTAMGNMSDAMWFLDNANPSQQMRNSLYLNAGNGRFMEGAYLAGLAKTNWTWAVRLCDFDHDGRNDAYFQCGMSRNLNERDDPELVRKANEEKDNLLTLWELYRHLPAMKEDNRVFRNQGEFEFSDKSDAWGLNYNGMSYGCSIGDLDGDGALDIVSARLDAPVAIYHNTAAEAGESITFAFRGAKSDSRGIGVQVRLFIDKDDKAPLVRTMNPFRGYMGSDQHIAHFGLGKAKEIDRIELFWPSGQIQVVKGLESGHHYTITEQATPGAKWENGKGNELFEPDPTVKGVVHRETRFDDFEREPLLPNKLSQMGPGQCWGDINGDGLDDLYLGGSKGSARALYLRRTDGSLTPQPLITPSYAPASEDMGVLFFDADADGDLDLYVVSGGVECEEDDPSLQDRLYLNDGIGKFERAPQGSLPENRYSGSCVSAIDFDRDGDLDLFVGGRSVPGKYPTAARSQLLRNVGEGNFVDATEDWAPILSGGDAGIITGAVWSDLDNDGWPDLALSRDWDSLLMLKNSGSQLGPFSQSTDFEKSKGWWNGISAGDLDGDGDFDLVATNFGGNTKYHPTPEKPVYIFYGDLQGSGESHIVEAEYEDDILYPVRGKSCSTAAMPELSDKFRTFKGFAAASLAQIYTPEKLDSVEKFEANTLKTSIFWNDGKGGFTKDALPWEAQLSPSFGVVIQDFDGDGMQDIVLAQNFFNPQRETGRMAGGLSLLLRGQKGDNGITFEPVWPNLSGINVPGDAKSLAVFNTGVQNSPGLSYGLNNSRMDSFSLKKPMKYTSVRLGGGPGNPRGIGARLVVNDDEHLEVRAGEGYLSQSSPHLLIAGDIKTLEVRWPDGQISKVNHPEARQGILKIEMP